MAGLQVQRLLHGLNDTSQTLTQRLEHLHQHLLDTVPVIDRIACAIYDAQEDLLKTFINSTRVGTPISRYEYRLSESKTLMMLAQKGEFRVLDDLASTLRSDTTHTRWLLEQGYQSSFTVPVYSNAELLGFVFFDSRNPGAFGPAVQRDLVLFSNLIGMTIAGEMAAVRTVMEATRVARELAEVRDFETGAHLERMARYSRLIAQAVAPVFHLDDEFVESVYLFSSLHDIGKIGIPDKVLLKPGKLDPDERVVMETHVDKGVQIIDRIVGVGNRQRLPDSSILRNIVHCHHEYLNGSGYPRRLKGDAIPPEARIVTVADITMHSRRCGPTSARGAMKPRSPSWRAWCWPVNWTRIACRPCETTSGSCYRSSNATETSNPAERVGQSATKLPDLPPCFSSSFTSEMTMPRSAALHMS